MLQHLTNSVEVLESERALLETITKRDRTPKEQARFINTYHQLKTRNSKLQKLVDLDLPKWELLHILMDAEGTFWTPDECVTWGKQLAAHEGRGEAALRSRLGLPPDLTTQACDLVRYDNGVRVLYEEVKNLQGRRADGSFQVQEIQIGKHGRHAYCMWMMSRAEAGEFMNLSNDLRESIGIGEIGRPKLKDQLPNKLRDDIFQALMPSVVLGTWDAVIGTTRYGFIRIPRLDCDKAWDLYNVTKGSPKYVIKKDYIKARLLMTSVV